MSDFTRREFIQNSMLLAAGMAVFSCEDSGAELKRDSPGMLSENRPPKQIVIVGAGLSGLVAGYELTRAGHEVTILEARNRVGGRVLTLRTPFSDGHFAEAGAARIPPDHNLTLGYADHFGLILDNFYPNSGLFVNYREGTRNIIPTENFLNDGPWPGSVPHKEYLKIREGSDKLPQAFSTHLSEQIHLSMPVKFIEQKTKDVLIHTTDGTKFSADRVLCTVPLTVLKKINFIPALSPEKEQAGNGGYNYADSTRVFIQFKNRFWENENLNAWGYSDWPEEIWQPTWEREGPKGIIMSYLRYSRATEIDKLSKEKRIEQVLSRWDNIFPGANDQMERGVSHAWALEQWSGGAWASPSSDQNQTLGSQIGKAEGRIHFAGEHASEYHGWMQGALVSGLRAAKEMHEEN
jgi:monoamine oxidase